MIQEGYGEHYYTEPKDVARAVLSLQVLDYMPQLIWIMQELLEQKSFIHLQGLTGLSPFVFIVLMKCQKLYLLSRTKILLVQL